MSPSPKDSLKPLALESLLNRDRQVILFALAVIALASCYYTIRMSGFFDSGKHGHGHTEIDALLLFGMWTVMMVAMMLPSVTPAVLLVAALSRKNRPNSSPFSATTWFLFGYIAVWTLFSAVAAFGQVLLHNFSLLNADMAAATPLVGGGFLILAGVFQFSSWKNACLQHCRSPLAFMMTQWRPGDFGAFMMGIIHGSYCTACCWALMLLMFVAGVMNVSCFLALTGFVLVEKMQRRGMLVARAAGGVFFVCGVVLLASS